MSLISLIVALLLEQARPLPRSVWGPGPLQRYAAFMESRFNAGEAQHGMIAWLLVVLPPVVLSVLAYAALWYIHPLLALAFNIGVLYVTMGFRQTSHYFSDIHLALRMGELDQARRLIGEWRRRQSDRLSSGEVARLAIEEGLVASHRQVFAVVFWFVLLPGPSGALLYRLALFLAQQWAGREDTEFGRFGRFAQQAFHALDWLPARVTAGAFSVVGDFEDAVYCWRTQAGLWPDAASGILVASGAGALGVRLGMPIHESGEVLIRPEIGLGEDADADFMQSTIGLVWRTLVLFLLVLALMWVASWVGY